MAKKKKIIPVRLLIVFTLLCIMLCLVAIYVLNGMKPISLPKPKPKETPVPTATAPADNILSWANYFAKKHETRDVDVRDVRLIESEANGKDVCFIIDLNCEHSNTALQFSCLNEVMINICQDMSKRDYFDCVSFTVYDTFVDKYGNAQDIVSITASYSYDTLRKINYSYQSTYKYTKPTGFIMCGDTYYIHSGYSFK